jgi:hypothetical protein
MGELMARVQPVRKLYMLLAIVCCAGMPLSAQAQGWKPDRPVELIVDCTPGCGPDSMVRLMQRVFQANRFLGTAVTVQNKTGGTLARTYLNQFTANGHYLYHGGDGVLRAHAVGRGNYTDWKAEMDKRSGITEFMAAAPMKKRMEEEYPVVKALLVDLGLAKP